MSTIGIMSQEFFDSLTPYRRTMLALESQFDYELSVANLGFDYIMESGEIDLREIGLRVLLENGSFEMYDSLVNEAVEGEKSGIINSLKKICDAIINFFQNTANIIKEKVTKVFAKKLSEGDLDDVMNLSVNIEYQKKLQEIEDQMSTGERLMHTIASKTGISEGTLNGYLQSVNKLVSSLPKIAVKAAGTAAAAGGVVILSKNYKTIAGGLSNKIDSATRTINRIKSKITGKAPKEEKEVLSATAKLSRAYNDIVSKITLGMASLTSAGRESNAQIAVSAAAAKVKPKDGGISKKDKLMAGVDSIKRKLSNKEPDES